MGITLVAYVPDDFICRGFEDMVQCNRQVNGSEVWKSGSFIEGVSGITWSGEDANFIKFNAALGAWVFTAK